MQATGLRPATLLKKRLWLRSFPVKFAKFLRTPFFYRIPLVTASGYSFSKVFYNVINTASFFRTNLIGWSVTPGDCRRVECAQSQQSILIWHCPVAFFDNFLVQQVNLVFSLLPSNITVLKETSAQVFSVNFLKVLKESIL